MLASGLESAHFLQLLQFSSFSVFIVSVLFLGLRHALMTFNWILWECACYDWWTWFGASTYSFSNISHCVVWFLMTIVQSQAELRRGND